MNQEYRGTRIRYYKLWHQKGVYDFIELHPAGKKVTVYYDPANPEEAVLLNGVDGGPLFMAMFLMPFNCGGLIALYLLIYYWRGSTRLPFMILENDGEIRVRQSVGIMAVFGIALFSSCILVACFVACCGGMPPSFGGMLTAWSVVAACSMFVCINIAWLKANGYYDVVFDRIEKTLTISPSWVEGGPVVIAIGDIVAVDIADEQDEAGVEYFAVVHWRNPTGELHESKLPKWSSKADVQLLATTLNLQIAAIPKT